jgi:hypothetical protein
LLACPDPSPRGALGSVTARDTPATQGNPSRRHATTLRARGETRNAAGSGSTPGRSAAPIARSGLGYTIDVILRLRYHSHVWDIEYTDQFEEWWEGLNENDQERIDAVISILEARGPALGRPAVGEVAGSRIKNLKELIPRGSAIRILFVFDPRRTAILLLGADKAEHGWKAWYSGAIEQAERLYEDHLEELRKEGLIE